MTAPLKTIEPGSSISDLMQDIGKRARKAAHVLALAPSAQKDKALLAMAKAIRGTAREILAANEDDVTEAKAAGISGSFLDRLTLNPARIEAMAKGLEVVARLNDPVGKVLEKWKRPNGMTIERVRTPIGVIGVIYESRPNVTADAGALCLKAGNAAILRGGSDSHRSSRAIHAAMMEGLRIAATAGRRDPAGAGARPRCGRRNAVRPQRQYRCDRAARRQEPGRARAGGSARSGIRSSRRHLPRLYRQEGQAGNGEIDRAECQDAPYRRLRRGRDLADRQVGAGKSLQARDRGAARCRLRSARRCSFAEARSAHQARKPGGFRQGISRRHHRRQICRRRRRRDERISNFTARIIPTRSSPRTRLRRRGS